jgi:hypothetical protein
MKRWLAISEEFKITNIKVANYAEIHPFENCDRWFKSKFLYWLMTKKVVKNVKPMYFFSTGKRCKEAFDNTIGSCKSTMGEYSIPAEVSIMDVFPYFSGEEEDLEKIEKFNALKASRPEVVADTRDTI